MLEEVEAADLRRRVRAISSAAIALLVIDLAFGVMELASGELVNGAANLLAAPVFIALLIAARRGHVLVTGYAVTLLALFGLVLGAVIRGNPGYAPFFLVMGVLLGAMVLPPPHVLVVVAVGLACQTLVALWPQWLPEPVSVAGVYAEGTALYLVASLVAVATSASIARLVREVRSRELQLREAMVRAREVELEMQEAGRMEALGRLAGGVAHDFNNVLMVIRGCASLLEEPVGTSTQARADLQALTDAVDRGSKLTKQMLTFSRRELVVASTLDVRDVVSALHDLLQRIVGVGVQLTIESTAGPCPIRASTTELEQVLMNLATNARDAMAGSGALQIRVSRAEDPQLGPCCRLSVVDTGSGMSEAVRARIFEPLFTTKAPDKGSGLGLATVHTIVNRLGGRIDVESVVGKGTTFLVVLPLSAEQGAALAAKGTGGPADAARAL